MSGKSAILRQTALIVLLAQMGSFVPAESAQIGYVDKIFTRVGASDNISMGESTFMVEMNETASILNNLSERSLVLLDEIGRGTSTYDGISIAWAISEYLHEHPARAKTLFATHYHELNEMTATFDRIKNFNVSVKELKDNVLFLRKLTEGGSEHSFGIHMIPLLEQIKEEITHLDINTLTPVEALMKLNEIKRDLKDNTIEDYSIGQPLGFLALRENQEEQHNSEVRFNDGAVDPKGRIFGGTMEWNGADNKGKLFRLNTDHSWNVLEENIHITNGMGWNPEKDTFFMIDTNRNAVFAYDYEIASGDISNKRTHIQFADTEFPDGMTIDSDGGFWIALWGGGALVQNWRSMLKRGVWEAGGFPLEFPVMSLGETLMKPTTMLYRNLASMDAEESIRGNPLDGIVLLGGCDKTTPSILMGACSVDLPTIFISGGPMLNGKHKGRDIGTTDVWKFSEANRKGRTEPKRICRN
ncbi:DNA mismatch repair protein MutS [Nymphon striatum]|nr:DNA mismatch repair protein MutS [Nymphon striatum]